MIREALNYVFQEHLEKKLKFIASGQSSQVFTLSNCDRCHDSLQVSAVLPVKVWFLPGEGKTRRWRRPPCPLREKVGESAPQRCQLAQGEPVQHEVLEGGTFFLAQGKGPDIQAKRPCVRKQAVPVM